MRLMRFQLNLRSKLSFIYFVFCPNFFLNKVNFNVNLMWVLFKNVFRYLIVTKCEVVSPALEMEIKFEVKSDESGIILKPKQENEVKKDGPGIFLKPKQEMVAKSAAQIVHEQNGK